MRLLVALLILLGAFAVAWWLGPGERQQPAQETRDVAVASAFRRGDLAPASPTSLPTPPPILPEAHPWSAALCPADMVWVGPPRCPPDGQISAPGCVKGKRTVSVCMDPFEYPSQVGVFPAIMLDSQAAEEVCRSEGKRLCSETEWTFACRSVQATTGCNLGRVDLTVRTQELNHAERISREVAARDGRRRNDHSSCVNDFRVFDLLGNVQEWVRSEHPSSKPGALKGGRYNQVSIGCSRTIYVSDPWSRYPHTGVRCCADPLGVAPSSQ